MKLRKYEKLIWKVVIAILVLTNATLYLPALTGVYFTYGGYAIYVAFVLGVAATILCYKSAAQKSGAFSYVLATMKTLAFGGVIAVSYNILLSAHSGA